MHDAVGNLIHRFMISPKTDQSLLLYFLMEYENLVRYITYAWSNTFEKKLDVF